MTPAERDAAYLWDMLQAAREVVTFTTGMSAEEYLADKKTQRAVERALEIVGEAARKVSEEFERAHPEIAWQGIVAHRHVLAHEYGDVSQDLVWRVVQVHVPELIRQLQAVVEDAPEGSA